MPTFPAAKAPPAKPAIHLQGSRSTATTHLAVRVQAGFDPILTTGFPPTDFCLQALDRLAEEFSDSTDLKTLLCILAARAQAILNAIEDVKAFRSLTDATGQQLDEIGKLYVAFREGRSDDDYRNLLQTFAVVVSSVGIADEMLDVLIALDNGFDLSSIALFEHYPAGFIMTARVPIGGQLIGESHGAVLHRMTPAAVRFILMFEELGATMFVWSSDTGEGWAEEDTPASTGGIWAEGV